MFSVLLTVNIQFDLRSGGNKRKPAVLKWHRTGSRKAAVGIGAGKVAEP